MAGNGSDNKKDASDATKEVKAKPGEEALSQDHQVKGTGQHKYEDIVKAARAKLETPSTKVLMPVELLFDAAGAVAKAADAIAERAGDVQAKGAPAEPKDRQERPKDEAKPASPEAEKSGEGSTKKPEIEVHGLNKIYDNGNLAELQIDYPDKLSADVKYDKAPPAGDGQPKEIDYSDPAHPENSSTLTRQPNGSWSLKDKNGNELATYSKVTVDEDGKISVYTDQYVQSRNADGTQETMNLSSGEAEKKYPDDSKETYDGSTGARTSYTSPGGRELKDTGDGFDYQVKAGDNPWVIAEEAIRAEHPGENYKPSAAEVMEAVKRMGEANGKDFFNSDIYAGDKLHIPKPGEQAAAADSSPEAKKAASDSKGDTAAPKSDAKSDGGKDSQPEAKSKESQPDTRYGPKDDGTPVEIPYGDNARRFVTYGDDGKTPEEITYEHQKGDYGLKPVDMWKLEDDGKYHRFVPDSLGQMYEDPKTEPFDGTIKVDPQTGDLTYKAKGDLYPVTVTEHSSDGSKDHTYEKTGFKVSTDENDRVTSYSGPDGRPAAELKYDKEGKASGGTLTLEDGTKLTSTDGKTWTDAAGHQRHLEAKADEKNLEIMDKDIGDTLDYRAIDGATVHTYGNKDLPPSTSYPSGVDDEYYSNGDHRYTGPGGRVFLANASDPTDAGSATYETKLGETLADIAKDTLMIRNVGHPGFQPTKQEIDDAAAELAKANDIKDPKKLPEVITVPSDMLE